MGVRSYRFLFYWGHAFLIAGILLLLLVSSGVLHEYFWLEQLPPFFLLAATPLFYFGLMLERDRALMTRQERTLYWILIVVPLVVVGVSTGFWGKVAAQIVESVHP